MICANPWCPKTCLLNLTASKGFVIHSACVEVDLDVANLELARKVEGSDVIKLDPDVLALLEKAVVEDSWIAPWLSISTSGVTLVSITCNSVSKPEPNNLA